MANSKTSGLMVNCTHVTDDGQLTCSFLRDEWQTHMGADLSTPNSEKKDSFYENVEHHTHLDTKQYS